MSTLFDYFIQEGLHDMSTELQRIQVKMSGEKNGKDAYLKIWFEEFCLEKPEKVRRDANFSRNLI